MTGGPHSLLLVEGSSCVLIASLLWSDLSGAAGAFRQSCVPPYKDLKSDPDQNIWAPPAERSRTGDTRLSYVKPSEETSALNKTGDALPLLETGGQTGTGWTAVVPELDRLHVLLPEPLQLGGHGLISVPEGLAVLLGGLWLGDLDPEQARGDAL